MNNIESQLQIILNKYIDYLILNERKPSTIKRYKYDILGCFHYLFTEKEEFQFNLWESFTPEDFDAYFTSLSTELNYSDKTIHRIYVAVNKFIAFLILIDELKVNPLRSIHFSEQPDRKLLSDHFISTSEQEKLIYILTNKDGLTDKQLKSRPLLFERNHSIVHLMLHFGLTLKEIVSIRMNHIHFEQNTINLSSNKKITLSNDDKIILYRYYQQIPEPVRPNYHSDDPFFVAFDYNRGTYRWVYETNSPKALTEVSIQKMIRLEVKRAGLRKGISAQYLRNTYILQLIESGLCTEQIMYQSGLTSKLALKRYIDFFNTQKEVDIN